MNNIKWKDEAVFYANGTQFREGCGGFQRYNDTLESWQRTISGDELDKTLKSKGFQLNEMRIGDYIEASELDTEQKYNDAVEVFELFGFTESAVQPINYHLLKGCEYDFLLLSVDVFNTSDYGLNLKRKITHPQLMAIGKLKRAMIERDSNKQVEQLNMESIEPRKQSKKSIDYLNECMEVQKQRGEQYDSTGTGERSFNAAAKAFNAMTGQNLKGSDVCLILTCVKAVRQYSDPARVHEDSLLDLVSYASLWAEEINKELK
ncbi:DUF6378 domain-containing protein [Pseudoalteromonas marina]|uniref:DUF6378 domain-containing protein n=1 Tax=Pseudoalteromonas marina TaxID=267375 RepID=UPI0023F28E53|nr:DUF6378 domain-containing protein [Pseudoalteromonas marina]